MKNGGNHCADLLLLFARHPGASRDPAFAFTFRGSITSNPVVIGMNP
jgi:hypothetical protein